MLALQLEAEIECRLATLAAREGQTASELAHAALLSGLEEMEDCALAMERLAKPAPSYSAEDVKRALGL